MSVLSYLGIERSSLLYPQDHFCSSLLTLELSLPSSVSSSTVPEINPLILFSISVATSGLSFRKILELEDQIPKLEKDEERLRKIWIMERDKVEAIYDDLKEKETLAELEAEETQEEEAE